MKPLNHPNCRCTLEPLEPLSVFDLFRLAVMCQVMRYTEGSFERAFWIPMFSELQKAGYKQ